MEHDKGIRYFLGGNTAAGFYSLYDEFTQPEAGDFLWIIKGGPGCGKSSFMKRIARAAEGNGLTVERILCSGDPESLDGIYIRQARCAYVDGTAPHVQEAALPGVSQLYLDLGAYYHPQGLAEHKEELKQLFVRYRRDYRQAYDLLQAAGLSGPAGPADGSVRSDVARRAASMARRWLPEGDGGRIIRRFLSAYTCAGPVFLWETAAALCPRICTLDNELGLASTFLESILGQCRIRGLSAVACPDPLRPEETEAVLIPEAGIGFLAVTRARPYPGQVWRHLRLDAMAGADALRSGRESRRRAQRRRELLLYDAGQALAAAKAKHDQLEAVYNPYVDFSGVYDLCEAHTDYLLGRLE